MQVKRYCPVAAPALPFAKCPCIGNLQSQVQITQAWAFMPVETRKADGEVEDNNRFVTTSKTLLCIDRVRTAIYNRTTAASSLVHLKRPLGSPN